MIAPRTLSQACATLGAIETQEEITSDARGQDGKRRGNDDRDGNRQNQANSSAQQTTCSRNQRPPRPPTRVRKQWKAIWVSLRNSGLLWELFLPVFFAEYWVWSTRVTRKRLKRKKRDVNTRKIAPMLRIGKTWNSIHYKCTQHTRKSDVTRFWFN